MMTTLIEGSLELTVPTGAVARKFDDPTSHRLSHCMKAVDFVVELPERRLFIEIKDPQAPGATEKSSKEFIESFCAGKLDKDLKYKYRDSFLYELASGNDDKAIHYYVIIAVSSLSGAELLRRTEELKRVLPVKGPQSGAWNRQIVDGCSVFNIETWNRNLPQFPLSRRQPAC